MGSRLTFRGLAALVGAGVLLLTACGGGDEQTAGNSSGGGGSVATRDHPQLGTILTDSNGMTLYFSEQEADGTVKCVQSCLNDWPPVVLADGTPPAVDGVSDLGVVQRSDNGQQQLTYQGKPLYTFRFDQAAGDAKGENAQDEFEGTLFVWHAASVGGSPNAPAPGENSDPYGGDGY